MNPVHDRHAAHYGYSAQSGWLKNALFTFDSKTSEWKLTPYRHEQASTCFHNGILIPLNEHIVSVDRLLEQLKAIQNHHSNTTLPELFEQCDQTCFAPPHTTLLQLKGNLNKLQITSEDHFIPIV